MPNYYRHNSTNVVDLPHLNVSNSEHNSNLTLLELSSLPGLKCLHLNVSTLLPNIDEVKHLVFSSDIDVLSLNETRLDNSINDQTLNIPNYCLLSVTNNDVMVPRANMSLFKSSLAYNGPKLWNNLPNEIKNMNSLYSFKISLKDYIMKQPNSLRFVN